VLYAHLVLFDFIYPGESARIPACVRAAMRERLASEPSGSSSNTQVCQGTLLSRAQYLIDIEKWGYRDARLGRDGSMSRHEVELWTAAIDEQD